MADHAFTIAVCVNDDDVLKKNLLLSPGLFNDGRNQLVIRRGFSSASVAYNSVFDEATNDVIVFVHQDVYLPATWLGDLTRCMRTLQEAKTNWGVLGSFGSRKNADGGLGRIYTRGLGWHGNRLTHPEPIETLDEIVLVVRKSSGLRFDAEMPHFHLYGTDICLTARAQGLQSFAFQGFCVHNTNQLLTLPVEFYTCYHYIRRKWRRYLPIHSSCMTISRLNEELLRKRLTDAGERLLRRRRTAQTRADDPRVFCEDPSQCGGARIR